MKRFVNEIIFEDRPVHVRYGTGAELAALGVQKESEREGILRAVEIQGVDIQACGGTHVCRTGQIGMILVRRIKKVSENWRVEFVCGQRARRVARADFTLLEDISQRLTCGPDTIHAGITRILNERNAGQSNRASATWRNPRRCKLKCFWPRSARNMPADPPRIVTGILADADMEYLRTVATNIITRARSGRIARVRGKWMIVMAKSEGVLGGHERVVARNGQALRRKRRRDERVCPGKRAGRKRPPPDFAARRGTRGQAGPSLHVVGRNSAGAKTQNEFWRSER